MDGYLEDVILEFERDLRSFVHYLKENHIVPVLSTYPTLITPFNRDVYENISLVTGLRFCIELSEDGILDASRKCNDTMRKIAKEQDLIFLDKGHLIPKTLDYFADNFHYTDKGVESMAKKVYYILNHYGLIK